MQSNTEKLNKPVKSIHPFYAPLSKNLEILLKHLRDKFSLQIRTIVSGSKKSVEQENYKLRQR